MNLIDRKAAIDALKNDMASLDHIIKGMSANDVRLDAYVSQRNQVSYDIDTINNLPTAQPEIILCKDCKHHWTHKCMDSMPIERCDLEQTFYDAEHDFCSLAERREVME